VLVIEHVALYNATGRGARDLDYFIPLGKAKVVRRRLGLHRARLLAMTRPGREGG